MAKREPLSLIMGNYTTIVIDFETTGLSPGYGDRIIEVGAVLISNNQIEDRFQSLMDPEKRISGFIENYTGISNRMLSRAPSINEVMHNLKTFLDQHHLVAHNASFDSRFLDAELDRINYKRSNEFVCSMLTSRRLYPEAPNHKLETLVRYNNLKTDGIHHRALADAEMTAHLWIRMIEDIKSNYGFQAVSFGLMQQLSRIPLKKVPEFMMKMRLKE